MEIYRPEKIKAADPVRTDRDRLNFLLDQRYKLTQEIIQLKSKLESYKQEKELTVTEHAVQRFKERIHDIPTKHVKKILSHPDILKKYLMHGGGKFRVPLYPNVHVVVQGFKVVTCYNAFDARVKLKELKKYMDYYIDALCAQVDDPELTIMPIKQFREQLYN